MPGPTNDMPTREPPETSWQSPRVWGVGEDPMAWSLPLFSAFGLRVRVHMLLVLWVAAEMVAWVPRGAVGLVHVFAAVVSIGAVLVVREIVREGIRRGLGGEPQPIVLWPLGGLGATPVGPVPRPFLAASGGLLAGAILVPVLGTLVVWSGAGWASLSLDLLSPRVTAGGLRSHAQIWAWWAYYTNAVVLVTNALLPMLPMDAGRLTQVFIGRRALRVALWSAAGVFVLGACLGEMRILALGAVGALASYLDVRREEFAAGLGLGAAPPRSEPLDATPDATADLPEADPAADLDAVLRQISRRGMASLSSAQRETLRRETERRRQR